MSLHPERREPSIPAMVSNAKACENPNDGAAATAAAARVLPARDGGGGGRGAELQPVVGVRAAGRARARGGRAAAAARRAHARAHARRLRGSPTTPRSALTADEAVLAELAALSGTPRGRVRMTFVQTPALALLSTALRELAETAPDLRVEVKHSETAPALADLRSRAVDLVVGIDYDPIPVPAPPRRRPPRPDPRGGAAVHPARPPARRGAAARSRSPRSRTPRGPRTSRAAATAPRSSTSATASAATRPTSAITPTTR